MRSFASYIRETASSHLHPGRGVDSSQGSNSIDYQVEDRLSAFDSQISNISNLYVAKGGSGSPMISSKLNSPVFSGNRITDNIPGFSSPPTKKRSNSIKNMLKAKLSFGTSFGSSQELDEKKDFFPTTNDSTSNVSLLHANHKRRGKNGFMSPKPNASSLTWKNINLPFQSSLLDMESRLEFNDSINILICDQVTSSKLEDFYTKQIKESIISYMFDAEQVVIKENDISFGYNKHMDAHRTVLIEIKNETVHINICLLYLTTLLQSIQFLLRNHMKVDVIIIDQLTIIEEYYTNNNMKIGLNPSNSNTKTNSGEVEANMGDEPIRNALMDYFYKCIDNKQLYPYPTSTTDANTNVANILAPGFQLVQPSNQAHQAPLPNTVPQEGTSSASRRRKRAQSLHDLDALHVQSNSRKSAFNDSLPPSSHLSTDNHSRFSNKDSRHTAGSLSLSKSVAIELEMMGLSQHNPDQAQEMAWLDRLVCIEMHPLQETSPLRRMFSDITTNISPSTYFNMLDTVSSNPQTVSQSSKQKNGSDSRLCMSATGTPHPADKSVPTEGHPNRKRHMLSKSEQDNVLLNQILSSVYRRYMEGMSLANTELVQVTAKEEHSRCSTPSMSIGTEDAGEVETGRRSDMDSHMPMTTALNPSISDSECDVDAIRNADSKALSETNFGSHSTSNSKNRSTEGCSTGQNVQNEACKSGSEGSCTPPSLIIPQMELSFNEQSPNIGASGTPTPKTKISTLLSNGNKMLKTVNKVHPMPVATQVEPGNGDTTINASSSSESEMAHTKGKHKAKHSYSHHNNHSWYDRFLRRHHRHILKNTTDVHVVGNRKRRNSKIADSNDSIRIRTDRDGHNTKHKLKRADVIRGTVTGVFHHLQSTGQRVFQYLTVSKQAHYQQSHPNGYGTTTHHNQVIPGNSDDDNCEMNIVRDFSSSASDARYIIY